MSSPTPARHLIRRITPEDWPSLRALRLEALEDSPTAFSVTHAATAALPDTDWQALATEAATSPSAALFVALDPSAPSGAFIGMAGAAPLPDVPETAHVHGVYVTPAHRGPEGPAAALVAAATAFAETHIDVTRLTLGVHESNARAQSFYARLGFEPTGLRVPYALNPAEQLVILGYPAFRPRAR
ncbi:GNAT family N-acetyltransferase [Kitasatospora sp. NPDC004614]|uniref:GNAT family N-acetyltransferase n=1 Tax=unclassified Kitasatospora TaxID=2633591 RepID=UPI003675976A